MIGYSKVALDEVNNGSIRNESLAPISRPPSNPRDKLFGLAFAFHLCLIFAFSVLPIKESKNESFNYDNARSLSSLMVIAAISGGIFGAILSISMANEVFREILFSYSLKLSIILKLFAGIVFLIMQPYVWCQVIGVIILLTVVVDVIQFNSSNSKLKFTSALAQFSLTIGKLYGSSLFFACSIVVILQTLVLLWWSATLISFLQKLSLTYSNVVMMVMLLSLYWISQFFSALMSYLVGGCVLWHFVREDEEELEFSPSRRVSLHMRCALTASFGTICKGALLSHAAHIVLAVNNWAKLDSATSASRAARSLASWSTGSLTHSAMKYNKLAYCLTATFGRTFCKAAEVQAHMHPETIRISVEDNTAHALRAISTFLAGFVAVICGIIVENHEENSWIFFLILVFYLNYEIQYLGYYHN
jgi:hypothetical protein